MPQAPITVWNEVRITSDGISISLLSESRDGGAIVEDEAWFTFDELQAQSPSAPKSLNLSDETVANLDQSRSRQFGDSQQSAKLQVGDVVKDTNSPDWSVDDRVEVVSISDKSADEYIVQESDFGRPKTVADVNYDSDSDETVIEAKYLDESGLPYGKVYAFPESRLEEV